MRALAAALLLAGCTVAHPPVTPPAAPSEAARLLARGDDLVRQGTARQAREVYQRVVHDHPDDPAAPQALYALGLLYVDPTSSVRDSRAAHTTFDRLLARYPGSPEARSARVWHALLGELERRTLEAERARADLERLKALDMELERGR